MSTNTYPLMRWSALLLGSFYVIALIVVTPLAYAGTLWLGASERGWQTRAAAAALIAGWLALAAGAVLVWKAARTRQRSILLLGVVAGLLAIAAYAAAYQWGGGMLI